MTKFAPLRLARWAAFTLVVSLLLPATGQPMLGPGTDEAPTIFAREIGDRLDDIERRIKATERHRRLQAFPRGRPSGSVPGSGIDWARLDQRTSSIRRRLESTALELEGVMGDLAWFAQERLELTARIETLRTRLDLSRKSVSGSWLPGPAAGAAPINDTCASATEIGNGTFSGDTSGAGSDGDASCGESEFSPDVWFKYTAPATGAVYFNTFGSSYDTVLSLHSSCPGTVADQIACNNDAGSPQSELLRSVTSAQVFYVRVSGYARDAGVFSLNVGVGGSISGTVTEEGTATPISSAAVTVYRAAAGEVDFIGIDLTDAAGAYSVGGLSPGTYRAIASNKPQVNELRDDIPCPGGINSCFPERGAPVAVAGATDTPDIDFALAPGGSISGTVTAAGTSSPLLGASVGVFDAGGNFVFNDLAAADGTYSVTGLPDGDYFVATLWGTAPQADELYDDIPCPGGGGSAGCSPRRGTPVAVTAPNDTPGIDFELALGGSIDGTLTKDPGGALLSDIDVELYAADGAYLDSTTSEADGTYSFDGLHSGIYRTVTFFATPYIDEAWNNVACFGGAPFGCLPTVGHPISVTAPAPTSSIDFALSHGGSISGTVTEQGSGTPLPAVSVEIYDPSGAFMDFSSTVGDGSWVVEGLPTGSYRAQTFAAAPHSDELYDDIACPGGRCDVAPGAAVEVNAPAEISNIDFALALGGSISGTVTEEGSGTPLASVEVDVFNSSGSFVSWDVTAPDGRYSIGGLPTGSYYPTTSGAPLHVDELHSDIDCPGGGAVGCDPATGTAVVVTAPSGSIGVDFALALGGAIRGSVTDAITLLPLDRDLEVTIFDASGALLNVVELDGVGQFSSTGLPSGTYYARTEKFSGFFRTFADERFDDFSCVGTCDPELGTPISVTLPSVTSNIDFLLHLPGADPDLELSKEDLLSDADFCAPNTITLGPDFGVMGAAQVSFFADGSIIFQSGFSAASGAQIEAGTNTSATCP